jgi:hypothetical protein
MIPINILPKLLNPFLEDKKEKLKEGSGLVIN